MKNLVITLTVLFLGSAIAKAAPTDCSASGSDENFFSYCSAQTAVPGSGDYHITINGNTLFINGDLTINGTLTIKLVGGSGSIVIQSGFTLSATNIVFDGSATGKVLNVESGATIDVSGTLDFGGNSIEVDGSGTIDAGIVTGGTNVTCDGDGDCPGFIVDTCADASGLCTETALPIELLFFTGDSEKETVSLNWATAIEENFDYFEIERASQGTGFEFIGRVKGDGNSFSRLDYSFEDESPEIGLNYYRLKSIDLDGTFEYSDVILVKFTSNVKLVVSPNPTFGVISIKTSIPTTEGLKYEITNQYGVVVLAGKLSAFNTQIDLQGLTKGIYIIRLVELPTVKAKRIILK